MTDPEAPAGAAPHPLLAEVVALIAKWRAHWEQSQRLAANDTPRRDEVSGWIVQGRVWAECANQLAAAVSRLPPPVLPALTAALDAHPRCDCGAPVTTCAACAVADYQAAHVDCATCCPSPAARLPPDPAPQLEEGKEDIATRVGSIPGSAALGSTASEDCGYQDVGCWDRQLRAAGWLPVSGRTGKEAPGSNIWRSPNGLLYRGPYKAWTVMRDARAEVIND